MMSEAHSRRSSKIRGVKNDEATDPILDPSVFSSAESSNNQTTCVTTRRCGSGTRESAGDLDESDFSTSLLAAPANDAPSRSQNYNISLPGIGPQMFVQWEAKSR